MEIIYYTNIDRGIRDGIIIPIDPFNWNREEIRAVQLATNDIIELVTENVYNLVRNEVKGQLGEQNSKKY